MMEVFVSIFLLCEAIEDIKTQKLDLLRLIVFGILAVVMEFIYIQGNWREVLTGTILGIVTLAIAWLTKEAIGYGDGVVMLILGICCGLDKTIKTFMLAVIIMICIAVVMMIRKSVRFDFRIPFIPCLFIGYVGGMLL